MIELPALTGSQRQIAWAKDIRDRAVQTMHEDMAKYYAAARRKAGQDHLLPVVEEAYLQVLTEHADAAWWIENGRLYDVAAKQLAKRLIEERGLRPDTAGDRAITLGAPADTTHEEQASGAANAIALLPDRLRRAAVTGLVDRAVREVVNAALDRTGLEEGADRQRRRLASTTGGRLAEGWLPGDVDVEMLCSTLREIDHWAPGAGFAAYALDWWTNGDEYTYANGAAVEMAYRSLVVTVYESQV